MSAMYVARFPRSIVSLLIARVVTQTLSSALRR
jgi:hypothetical protein